MDCLWYDSGMNAEEQLRVIETVFGGVVTIRDVQPAPGLSIGFYATLKVSGKDLMFGHGDSSDYAVHNLYVKLKCMIRSEIYEN